MSLYPGCQGVRRGSCSMETSGSVVGFLHPVYFAGFGTIALRLIDYVYT